MAKYDQKTKVEPQSIDDFIAAIASPQRQAEARELLSIYGKASGFAPRLYTGGMIGFGTYDYTYDSGFSGTAFATGFAPRKADLSLYGLKYGPESEAMLTRMGKHRAGAHCVYVKHLAAIDPEVLADLIRAGLHVLKSRYPVTPT